MQVTPSWLFSIRQAEIVESSVAASEIPSALSMRTQSSMVTERTPGMPRTPAQRSTQSGPLRWMVKPRIVTPSAVICTTSPTPCPSRVVVALPSPSTMNPLLPS